MSDKTIFAFIVGAAIAGGGAYWYFVRRPGAGASLSSQEHMARMGKKGRGFM